MEDDPVDSSDIEGEEHNIQEFLQMGKASKEKRGAKLPKEIELKRQQAVRLYIDGQFNQAFDKLKEVMKVYPKIPELYYIAAMIYEEQGKIGRAAQFFEINAELSLPDSDRWCKIGDLYYQTQYYEQAAYCYGRALKSDPQNIDLMKRRAEAYGFAKEPKKAILMYNRILRIVPDIATIKQCAKLHCINIQYQKAREVLKKAPMPNIVITFMICQTYLKERNYKQVLEELSSNVLNKLDISKAPIQILNLMVICCFKLDQPESQQLLDIMLSRLTSDFMKMLESFIAELETTHPRIVIKVLNSVRQIKQAQPAHYMKLAQIYNKENDLKAAVEVLQEGIRLYPQNKEIKTQLGYWTIKSGKEAEGAAILRREEQESEQQIYLTDQSDNDDNVVFKPQKIEKPKPKIKKQLPENVNQASIGLSPQSMNTLESIPQLLCKNTNPQTLQSFYPAINNLLVQVIELSKTRDGQPEEVYQKRGIFQRNVMRKKRKTQSHPAFSINSQRVASLLANWLEEVAPTKCWSKLSTLSTEISRLNILNRYPEYKQRIYRMCVLASLNLQRYRKALFFLKYLLFQTPSNICYTLLANVLLRKVGGSKIYRTFLSKLTKRALQQPNLHYLLAFEHIEGGSFKHAVKELGRLEKSKANQQMIDLSFAICFLQLASSRNTSNKLAMVNRSVYFFNEYRSRLIDKPEKAAEIYYNVGRFFAQLKVNQKAIQFFNEAIKQAERSDRVQAHLIRNNAAYCIMCVNRELEDREEYTRLSQTYFTV